MKGKTYMEKNKKLANPLSSAEIKGCIDAETAVVSTPHTGDTQSLDAEGDKKTAEFEELIRNKYKKQFSDKVKSIISRRIKEVKSLKEKSEKDAATVEMIMKKFNVESDDTQDIERGIDEAMSEKTDKKHAQLIQRLIAENEFLKKENEKRMYESKAKSVAEKLKAQAEETKKVYADFDIKKELENPEFRRLVRAGVNIKNAYEVLNMDGILDSNSREAERQAIEQMKSKTNRPVENGSKLSGGILLTNGISKLTKKQRAELAKRAASGEKIEF